MEQQTKLFITLLRVIIFLVGDGFVELRLSSGVCRTINPAEPEPSALLLLLLQIKEKWGTRQGGGGTRCQALGSSDYGVATFVRATLARKMLHQNSALPRCLRRRYHAAWRGYWPWQATGEKGTAISSISSTLCSVQRVSSPRYTLHCGGRERGGGLRVCAAAPGRRAGR